MAVERIVTKSIGERASFNKNRASPGIDLSSAFHSCYKIGSAYSPASLASPEVHSRLLSKDGHHSGLAIGL